MHLHSDKAELDLGPARPAPARLREAPAPTALVARCKAAPEAVVELQRSVGNAAVVQLLRDEDAAEAPSPVLGVVGHGGGQPLDSSVRAGMENALGADLSGVRVHTDGAAAASAQAVQAHAYTVGDEVVFGAGQYQPGSPAGQRTLAHELTHVVQQRNGPVSGTPAGNGHLLERPLGLVRAGRGSQRRPHHVGDAEQCTGASAGRGDLFGAAAGGPRGGRGDRTNTARCNAKRRQRRSRSRRPEPSARVLATPMKAHRDGSPGGAPGTNNGANGGGAARRHWADPPSYSALTAPEVGRARPVQFLALQPHVGNQAVAQVAARAAHVRASRPGPQTHPPATG